jgi:hypothetical protein
MNDPSNLNGNQSLQSLSGSSYGNQSQQGSYGFQSRHVPVGTPSGIFKFSEFGNPSNSMLMKSGIIILSVTLLANTILWSFLPYDMLCDILEKMYIKDCPNKRILLLTGLISLILLDFVMFIYFRNPIYTSEFWIWLLIFNLIIIVISYIINVQMNIK